MRRECFAGENTSVFKQTCGGRVVGELLRLSHPALTVYDAEGCCWRDQVSKKTYPVEDMVPPS